MSAKPESKFIDRVHRKLKSVDGQLYRWKIHAQGQGGVSDCYYSGLGGDLWVEYKWRDKLPTRDTSRVPTGIEPLQRLWLQARHREGRKVALVIGSPLGVVILDSGEFPDALEKSEFIRSAVEFEQLIEYIQRHTIPQMPPNDTRRPHDPTDDHPTRPRQRIKTENAVESQKEGT